MKCYFANDRNVFAVTNSALAARHIANGDRLTHIRMDNGEDIYCIAADAEQVSLLAAMSGIELPDTALTFTVRSRVCTSPIRREYVVEWAGGSSSDSTLVKAMTRLGLQVDAAATLAAISGESKEVA